MIHPEQSAFRAAPRSFTEIDRDEIIRQTIDEAERRLSAMTVNTLYRQAFKLAIRVLRGMRP